MISRDTLLIKWQCYCIEQIRRLIAHGFYFSKRIDLQNALSGSGSLPDDVLYDLIVKYYDILCRIPRQQKRSVHECKGINCPPHLQYGYEMLKQELEDGCCLIPRMSRAAKDFDACDGMFNDWGIQHFHLGTSPDPNHPDLVQGDNFIAYVYMTETDAYIITIDVHGKWGEKDLLEKLLEDFPNVLDDWKTDAKELSYEVDGRDRIDMRKAHVNTPVVLKGMVYMRPIGGETLSGSSAKSVLCMQKDRKFFLHISDKVCNALIGYGWDDSDIANSKLLSFCRCSKWPVLMAKNDDSSHVMVGVENGKFIAKAASAIF